jgi:hypothetical protein
VKIVPVPQAPPPPRNYTITVTQEELDYIAAVVGDAPYEVSGATYVFGMCAALSKFSHKA